jgi:hypothetical protein
VPLARRVHLSTVRTAPGVSDDGASPLAMCGVPLSASLTAGTILHNTKTPLTTWF